VKCHFGDRDRYHAERGLAGSSEGSSTKGSGSRRGSLTTSRPNSPRGVTRGLGSSSSPTTVESWLGHGRNRSHSTPEPSSIESPRISYSDASTDPSPRPSPAVPPRSLSSATQASLFDPQRPDLPRSDLLEHLLEVFFDRLGCQLPFLQKEVVVGRMRSFSLPEHVANAIAAMAARFSDKSELVTGNTNGSKWMAGEAFLHKAKLLVVHQISWPTLDALHTLILIAWAEYGSARDSGLFNFARMASSMLVDLGLSSHSSLERVQDPQERELLKLTWSGVIRIDLTSAWVTGRSASLQGSQLQIDPFTSVDSSPSQASDPSTMLFDRLTKLYTIRDQVTKMMNSDCSRVTVEDGNLDSTILSIQTTLGAFFQTLGPTLAFNSENFKRFNERGQAGVFLLLHLMYHGSNTLVHWPSLFKEFARVVPHNIGVSCASARSLVSALRIAYTISPTTLLSNPFFDVPISVAARAFLAQRTVLLPDQTSIDNSWIESNLGTCMDVLARMAEYWGGSDIVGELLEQRGAKFHRRTSSSTVGVRSLAGMSHSASSPLPFDLPSAKMDQGGQASALLTRRTSGASGGGGGSGPLPSDLHLPLDSILSSATFTPASAPPASAPAHLQPTRSFNLGLTGLPGLSVMTGLASSSNSLGLVGHGSDSPLSTPRAERIQAMLSSGPATISTSTLGGGEDVFATFFSHGPGTGGGAGTIDNLVGHGHGGAGSFPDSHAFSTLLTNGLEHTLYPPPSQSHW